jgi:glyoxylase-like metal-dependent hydrolase (beta-lactamase superfamily II)
VPVTPLAEGDVLTLGRHAFAVWHLPGHAPGHVAFIGHGLCLSGDLLFAGSIGRTDLPLCDPAAMQASLARMATLDPALRVCPGHGPDTTIATELRTNPFLRGAARPR